MTTNDETVYGGGAAVDETREENVSNNNGLNWQQVVIGGVAGILMGAGGMYAANAFKSQKGSDVETTEETPADSTETSADDEALNSLNNITMNMGDVHVANINGNLSFGQAFAAARAQVGPGGVFHWHGNVYNTYTVEEWNSMSVEEHSTFASTVSSYVSTVHEYYGHTHVDRHAHAYHHHHVDEHIHEVHDVHVHEEHDLHVHDVHDVHVDGYHHPGPPPPPAPAIVENEMVQVDNSIHQDTISQGNTDESEVHVLGMDHVKLGDDANMNIGRNIINADDVVIMNVGNSPVYDTTPGGEPSFASAEAQVFHDKDMNVEDFAAQTSSGDSGYVPEAIDGSQDSLADGMPDYANDVDI